MNEVLAQHIVQEAINCGVREFCICPGARNGPLFHALMKENQIKKYFWFEERSSAFFALGRSRESQHPVAIVTTSGTAAGELLPATMEAYYTATPLLLITADRPRRYRGSGAPQAAEQVGLFGIYAPFSIDVALQETIGLSKWTKDAPAHVNVCFEEPKSHFTTSKPVVFPERNINKIFKSDQSEHKDEITQLSGFLQSIRNPFIIVSALSANAKEAVIDFLLGLNAPVFLEGVSGLREDSRLQHLRISRSENLWEDSEHHHYKIDGVLRIGGIPTFRFWRDLEDKYSHVTVCSLSEYPFSGLSRGNVFHVPLNRFFNNHRNTIKTNFSCASNWLKKDSDYQKNLCRLFHEEPMAEPSLFYGLSSHIPKHAHVYLGNSQPIREWDLAATLEDRRFNVTASRGLNGIDGQISTFLGLSIQNQENWAILGDLTTLYDMAGPWILSQLSELSANIVVVNNSGGKIFSRLFADKEFQNPHNLSFDPLAKMWGLDYERWESIPHDVKSRQRRLIELVPDEASTQRFWDKFAKL